MGIDSLGLAAFRAISSGTNNMGDVRISSDGKLEAVNRFVGRRFNNQSYVSVGENIAVRTAFLRSLSSDGRVSGDMLSAFEAVLLGKNAVKTLTRDEISACIKALDRRDVSNLAETIGDLEIRNAHVERPLASVKSSWSVALRLSVNERLDVARCYSQRAAESFANAVLCGAGGDEAGARSAFASFKSKLAQMLSAAVVGDIMTMREKVDAAFASFDPFGRPADFPGALEAPLKALLELEGGAVKGAVRDLLETSVLRAPDSLAPSLVEKLSASVGEAPANGAELPQFLQAVCRRRHDGVSAAPPAPTAPQPIEKPLGLKDVDDVGFVRGLCGELLTRQLSVAHDECRQTIDRCDRILATLAKTKAEHPAAAQELDGLMSQVRSRKDAEIRHRDNNPLSFRTVMTFFSKAIRAAEDLYRGQVGAENVRKDCLNELRLELGFLDGVKDYNDDCPDAGTIVGEAMDRLADRLKAVFSVHGVKVKHVHDKLTEAFNEVLCKEPWSLVEGEFLAVLPAKGNGRPAESVSVKNVIKAFKDIDGFADNVKYGEGINGVSCRMVKSEHATSAMNSQFFCGGKRVFNGVRTGVMCATGVGKGELESAARNRARETIVAAVLANDGVMGELKAKPQAVPTMLFTSTALLTPDVFRGALRSMDSDKNEKEMLKYQWQALNDLNGNDVEVKINGETRKVKVDILSFNFGVNKYAVGWRSSVTGGWNGEIDLRTGSETVREHNRGNVDLLERRVNDAYVRIDDEIKGALAETPADLGKAKELQKRKGDIFLLMRQLRSVIDSGSEGSSPEDTYKLGARVNMISYLIGGTPQWNCKSGKDRTGQLDVETKFLALLLASNRRIPEPGEKLSSEYSALLATIALETDNYAVQVYSSGLPGFKVDTPTVDQRLPDDENVMRRYAAFKDQIGA